ncbi:MAG: damage-inducible protein DinB, partial [Rhizobacter sp.]|nr:damage-inducible protein DinB [Burkholderiales bacterium]
MSTTTLLHSLFKYKAWGNDQLFAELGKVDAEAQEEARHNATRILNHIYVVDQIFAAHLS